MPQVVESMLDERKWQAIFGNQLTKIIWEIKKRDGERRGKGISKWKIEWTREIL